MGTAPVPPATSFDAGAFAAFEAAGWELKAAGYGRLIGQITDRVATTLLDAAAVGVGGRVLDAGCGLGYAAALAANRGAVAIGLDASSTMIGLARTGYPVPRYVVGSVDRLPFAADSFDAVVGNVLIHHLAVPEPTLEQFRRVLVAGGRVALTAWDTPQHARFVGVLIDAITAAGVGAPSRTPAGPPFFRYSGEGLLGALLEQCGFIGVAQERIRFEYRVDSSDELWTGLLDGTVRTSALVTGQSPEVQRRIRAAFERAVREYADGDQIRIPVSVRLASGRRPA